VSADNHRLARLFEGGRGEDTPQWSLGCQFLLVLLLLQFLEIALSVNVPHCLFSCPVSLGIPIEEFQHVCLKVQSQFVFVLGRRG